MDTAPDYLNPDLPEGLARVENPGARRHTVGVGGVWPPGRRSAGLSDRDRPLAGSGLAPGRPDCGDEGGTTEGVFVSAWRGDILYGRNEAVGGHYILGYAEEPSAADETHDRAPSRILLWHANYHPDGGQLFFPLEPKPFVVPLALPGDDVRPEQFVCFRFDGSRGLYIHPNIWHEGVFARAGTQRFFDKQGAVHARVSVDFAREFGCMLEVPLARPS